MDGLDVVILLDPDRIRRVAQLLEDDAWKSPGEVLPDVTLAPL
jgi:hypothetical protein